MKIDIICPLYNAADYIVCLNESLKMQKKVKINRIHYILTESTDDSEEILKQNHINATCIEWISTTKILVCSYKTILLYDINEKIIRNIETKSYRIY